MSWLSRLLCADRPDARVMVVIVVLEMIDVDVSFVMGLVIAGW